MVRIKHTADIQDFALTCTELSTLPNPFYLFVFVCDMTKEELKVVLPDTSHFKFRYNLFRISGTFFTSDGWHTYSVYEQPSEDNLDPAQSTGIVEEGRVFVDSVDDVQYTENNNSNINYKEYVG